LATKKADICNLGSKCEAELKITKYGQTAELPVLPIFLLKQLKLLGELLLWNLLNAIRA
jgi:hypothetical protein